MNTSPPKRKTLQWLPPPRHRVVAYIGLALCTVFGLVKIFSIPWMWQYVDQIHLNALYVAMLVPTLLLIVTDMRLVFPPGHCQNCGYNLTGNVSRACPECGAKK